MPAPSIRLHGAKQCTAKSKRTKLPCKNPAAYGCNTCRMHGARKSETIKRGNQHPNYVHGLRTLEAEKKSSEEKLKLNYLEDAIHLLRIQTTKRFQGRKASGYKKNCTFNKLRRLIA